MGLNIRLFSASAMAISSAINSVTVYFSFNALIFFQGFFGLFSRLHAKFPPFLNSELRPMLKVRHVFGVVVKHMIFSFLYLSDSLPHLPLYLSTSFVISLSLFLCLPIHISQYHSFPTQHYLSFYLYFSASFLLLLFKPS